MTRLPGEELTEEMIVRNLTHHLHRALQLGERLNTEVAEHDAEACVPGLVSDENVGVAVEQALTGWSLPEDVTCHVCGDPLGEGDAVVVYVFRPTGSGRYEIGHVVCRDDRHEQFDTFTVGVHELLVAGRVGWCTDVSTQSPWPVLLSPEVVGVSAAASKSLRLIPENRDVECGGEEPSKIVDTNEVDVT